MLIEYIVPVAAESNVSSQINCVISHPTLPVTITAHRDRQIRFFDNNTGESDDKYKPNIESTEIVQGPRWRSGNTVASHLRGRRFKPWTLCGKVGRFLPMVGS